MRTQARIAATAGVTVAGFLRERVARAPLKTADQIPTGPDAFTTEWLTSALCAGTPGAAVTAFRLAARDDGTTSRQAMSVTFNAAGSGLETRLFVKSTSRLRSRLMLNLLGAIPTECEFYARVRPALDIEAPSARYVRYDARDGRSLFITDDVMRTRDAEPGTPLVHVDRPRAESMVRLMATYHAVFWNRTDDPRLAHLPTSKAFQDRMDAMANFAGQSMTGLERTAAFCPPELLRRRDELYPAFGRAMELSVQGPQTLCHYDTHQGNWYRCGDGAMGLYDWQANVKSNWAGDVAYALSSALTVEDRRAWERELIELYLETLAEHGVPEPPTFAQAWLDYRRQMLHGLIFWLFTIGQSRFNPDMQPREVSEANCARMEQAVIDVDSFAAVR